MKRRLLIFVVLISMLGAIVTMACYCPPPPPPPPPSCDCECSPGFWKNHGPEKYGDTYWNGYDEDYTGWHVQPSMGLMAALTFKGGEGRYWRYAAAAFLNENAYCKCD